MFINIAPVAGDEKSWINSLSTFWGAIIGGVIREILYINKHSIGVGIFMDCAIQFGIFEYILLSLFIAITTGIVIRLVDDILIRNREKSKIFMEKYKELYSSVITYLSQYIYIKTNFQKSHDLHSNVIESDLLEYSFTKIEKNVQHFSPTLLKVYERYLGSKYYSTGKGINQKVQKHLIAFFYYRMF